MVFKNSHLITGKLKAYSFMLFLKQIRKMQQEQTNQEGVANIVAFDNSNDRL